MVAKLDGREGVGGLRVVSELPDIICMGLAPSSSIAIGWGLGSDSLISNLGRNSSNALFHSRLERRDVSSSSGSLDLREPLVLTACLTNVFLLAVWDSML